MIALDQRCAGAPSQASVEDVEAEPVNEGVTEHVQRVGEERGGSGQEPCAKLDAEHDDVDRQDARQDTTLAIPQHSEFQRLGFAAFVHRLASVNSACAS